MRILHRYIWREFFEQFLLCFLGFTVLGVGKILFDYNDLFIGYRVPPGLIGYLIFTQLPVLWMDVISAAVLFGVILSLGRLLREREFEVIRVCGSSLTRAVAPIFIGVGLFCLGAFCWNDWVVPAANHRFYQEVARLTVQDDLPLLKENVVFKAPQNRFVFLRQVHHRQGRIGGIIILEVGHSGKWPRLITADSGLIKNGIWELADGVIHEFNESGAISSEVSYEKLEVRMSNDFWTFISDEKTPAAMGKKELLKYYELSKLSGINSPVYAVYLHQKYADPLISLVLVFLAIPLTILSGRNSRWLGLIYCFLIMMGYYTIQVLGRTLGANGVLLPWIAAWMPHLLFLMVGGALLLYIEHRRAC